MGKKLEGKVAVVTGASRGIGASIAKALAEEGASAVAALREHLGLDKPFLVRYLDYVGRLVRGDLGRSIQQNRPVAAELADAWPPTLTLTLAALLIATVVGVAAGVAPTASWGLMVATGRNVLLVAPHVATIPGLAIMLAVLAFNLVGDGLRDALDPRLGARG